MKIPLQGMILISLLLCFINFCHASENQPDFDRFFCDEYSNEGECEIHAPSMINLIVTPERFHGKRVRVIAYVIVLFQSREFMLFFVPGMSEAVRLTFWKDVDQKEKFHADELDRRFEEIFEEFVDRKVIVEGIFNMNHQGDFETGEIYDISRLQIWRHSF
ncbi:MAG: hypothetical protein LBQ62_08065 [Candidatus Accumulibacter sp.]|jgi:hypothetical protein|nr:hypothetical protein [Accumulibacter sp.]